jgi:hypothetical protein
VIIDIGHPTRNEQSYSTTATRTGVRSHKSNKTTAAYHLEYLIYSKITTLGYLDTQGWNYSSFSGKNLRELRILPNFDIRGRCYDIVWTDSKAAAKISSLAVKTAGAPCTSGHVRQNGLNLVSTPPGSRTPNAKRHDFEIQPSTG